MKRISKMLMMVCAAIVAVAMVTIGSAGNMGGAPFQRQLLSVDAVDAVEKKGNDLLLEDCGRYGPRLVKEVKDAIEDVQRRCRKTEKGDEEKECEDLAKCGVLWEFGRDFKKRFDLNEDVFEDAGGKKGCDNKERNRFRKKYKEAHKHAEDWGKKLVDKIHEREHVKSEHKYVKNCICRNRMLEHVVEKYDKYVKVGKCDDKDKFGENCNKHAKDDLKDVKKAIDDAQDECRDDYDKCKKKKSKGKCKKLREECDEDVRCYMGQRIRKEIMDQFKDDDLYDLFENKECARDAEKDLPKDARKIVRDEAEKLVKKMDKRISGEHEDLCTCIQSAVAPIQDELDDLFDTHRCEFTVPKKKEDDVPDDVGDGEGDPM